jgi:hypothetical protein
LGLFREIDLKSSNNRKGESAKWREKWPQRIRQQNPSAFNDMGCLNIGLRKCSDSAVCQNLVPLVNIKIAGKWMFIPLKMLLIGIDPYPFIIILPRQLQCWVASIFGQNHKDWQSRNSDWNWFLVGQVLPLQSG